MKKLIIAHCDEQSDSDLILAITPMVKGKSVTVLSSDLPHAERTTGKVLWDLDGIAHSMRRTDTYPCLAEADGCDEAIDLINSSIADVVLVITSDVELKEMLISRFAEKGADVELFTFKIRLEVS